MSDPVDQHLVSKGYQKNFANDEKKVAVFDTILGQEFRRLKAIKSNFTEDHFNTLLFNDGTPDFALEEEYSKMEGPTLENIRKLTPTTTDPRLLVSAITLSAMHLVRSHAYRDFQSELIGQLGVGENRHGIEHLVKHRVVDVPSVEVGLRGPRECGPQLTFDRPLAPIGPDEQQRDRGSSKGQHGNNRDRPSAWRQHEPGAVTACA